MLKDNDYLVGSFTNFMNKVIRNEAINYHRKKQREEKEGSLDQYENVLESKASFYDGEKSINIKNLQDIFTNREYFVAIGQLTEKQKEVLYLSFVENKTGEQIAKIMNIQRNNVYNIRKQAIERAKKNLKDGSKNNG